MAYYAHLWALGLNGGYMTIPADKQFKEYTLMACYDAPSVALSAQGPGADGPAGPHPAIDNLAFYTSHTVMKLDIAALQAMYGANFGFRSTDTTYTWSPTTGAVYVDGVLNGVVGDGLTDVAKANKIFQTLWDGGGIDTYDLSSYATALKLDLRPGEYSTFSDGQRMYVGRDINGADDYARGNVYNALLYHDDPRSLIENAEDGAGRDVFVFNTTLNHTLNVDRITDFNVRDDTIRLENGICGKLTHMGTLSGAFFTIGPKARDANDYIIYNDRTGALSYDADGSGQGAAVLFANLSKGLHLTNADFVVV